MATKEGIAIANEAEYRFEYPNEVYNGVEK